MTDLLVRPDTGHAEPIASPRAFDPDAHRQVRLPQPIHPARRVWKHRRLMHHNRIAVAIVVANIAMLGRAVADGWFSRESIALDRLATMATLNIAAAILIRQHYVINAIFTTAASAPVHWPLRLRATLGKVYHVFGGVHIGAATSGTVWFGLLLIGLGYHTINDLPGSGAPLLVVSLAIVASLTAMTVTALPPMRAAHHDLFERTHRFAGWTVLALFWFHIFLLASALRPGESLVRSVAGSTSAVLLVLVTVSIALPWLRLRRVPVDVQVPSNHVAIAWFDYGVTPFAGSSTTISRSPLTEWHSFADIPVPGRDGYRLAISRAGDWTGQFIDDPPSHVWVKAVPTAGVGHIDKLFTKVVWVATGSGIGPTLPHLLANEVPSKLIWATREPRRTYGDEMVDEILDVRPDALIWDTDVHGKPDMVRLAYDAVKETGAEAVICISNKRLTWQVVEGIERLGIPAYGAIFDS